MNKEQIDKLVEDSLNSADGAGRAEPKPFLFTRLMARMERQRESFWERTGAFVGRPAVAIAGLCLVIGINAALILNSGSSSSTKANESLASSDEFSTSAATLDYVENSEP